MSPVSYRSRHLALSHVREMGLFRTVTLLGVVVESQSLATIPPCVMRRVVNNQVFEVDLQVDLQVSFLIKINSY